MSEILLQDLFIYPIKSAQGISLVEAEVTSIGLKNDRAWMLVDEYHRFISQRQFPQMALISVEVGSEWLMISAPRQTRLKVSFDSAMLTPANISVWNDHCQGLMYGNEVNQWFSDFLQHPVSLVRYDFNALRPTDPDYSKPGDHVSFADGFPLLVVSQSSLDDLNQRLQHPVAMASFRPNLVLSNTEAYAEDQWRCLRIGDVNFDVVKPCARCVLTTIDPATGIKRSDKEPLKTLAGYRRQGKGVMFGMNLIPRSPGHICLNDPVSVVY